MSIAGQNTDEKLSSFEAALKAFACKLRMFFDNGLEDLSNTALRQGNADAAQQISAAKTSAHIDKRGHDTEVQHMQETARHFLQRQSSDPRARELQNIAEQFTRLHQLQVRETDLDDAYALALKGMCKNNEISPEAEKLLKQYAIERILLERLVPDFMRDDPKPGRESPGIFSGSTNTKQQLESALAQSLGGLQRAKLAIQEFTTQFSNGIDGIVGTSPQVS